MTEIIKTADLDREDEPTLSHLSQKRDRGNAFERSNLNLKR